MEAAYFEFTSARVPECKVFFVRGELFSAAYACAGTNHVAK